MSARLLLAASAFALFAGTAQAADWKLVETAGQVRVAVPGVQPVAARQGQVLPIGSNITTLAGGRAVLDNGLQHIVVGPNSRMTLAPEQTAGMGRVVQELGAIFFQVDKKDKPHFRVESPLLTAVVKGTSFTVEVDALADTVNVAEGLVEVRSNQSELARDVPGGASATISRAAPAAVEVVTLTSDTVAASGPEPVVALPPIDYATASDGLIGGVAPVVAAVRGEAAPVAVAVSEPAAAVQTPQSPQAFGSSQPLQAMAPGAAGGGMAAGLGGGATPVAMLAAQVSNAESGPTQIASIGGAGRGPNGAGGPDNGNGGPGLGIGLAADAGGPGKDKNDNNAGPGNGNGGAGPGIDVAVEAAGPGKGGRDNGGPGGNGNGGPGPGIDVAVGTGGPGGPGKEPDKGSSGPGGANGPAGPVGGLVGGVVEIATGGPPPSNGNGPAGPAGGPPAGAAGGPGGGPTGNAPAAPPAPNGNGPAGPVGGLVGGVVEIAAGGPPPSNGNGPAGPAGGPPAGGPPAGGPASANGNAEPGLVGGLIGGVTEVVGVVTGGNENSGGGGLAALLGGGKK